MAEQLENYFESKAQTIQSQYSTSQTLLALIDFFHEHIKASDDIKTFYTNIFDIYTAKGYGLDVWGQILGLGRNIALDDRESYEEKFFGFLGSGLYPFDNQSFVFSTTTNYFRLEDEAYRKYLLFVQAYANIAQSDFYSMNKILAIIFPDKKQYVLPNGLMNIKFVFESELDDVERSILKQGLITRGAGISYSYLEVDSANSFGFADSTFQPFDCGVFTNAVEILSK